ncbi:MAG: hypothetical protein Q4D31_00265 [Eubacteriales bacterium]|nr:hypothetical protein [Eubacteriales bacterium]
MLRTNKLRRVTAAGLLLAFVLPQAAQAAAPTVDTDEAVYIDLDYYGTPTDTRIVKGVSLNGHTSFTDYGDYTAVYNMSTYDQPTLEPGAVTWALADDPAARFYYECIPTDDAAIVLPWTLDVSYKLNGVPVQAEACAGASGLIEMTVHAVPNTAASRYYQDNMMLLCATGVDMSEALSIEAPGAQVQSMGTYKLVVFLGMPGEESTFTVRIGSDSFESMGLLFFLAPATLSSLDLLTDLRDIKDRLGTAGDDLYDGLSGMLNTMQSMQSGLGVLSSGLSDISKVRKQLAADRDALDPKTDHALATLEALTGQTDALIPELEATKTTLTALNGTVDTMLGTLQSAADDVTAYQKLLKDVQRTLGDLDELTDELNDATVADQLRLSALQSAGGDLRDDLSKLQSVLKTLSRDLDATTKQLPALQGALGTLVPQLGLGEDFAALLGGLLQGAATTTADLSRLNQTLATTIEPADALLGTTDDILDDLSEVCEILDDYEDLPHDLTGQGKQLTTLLDRTLERVQQQLTDVGALSTSLDELTATAVSASDKGVSLLTALTDTLTAAHALLQTATDDLRAVRERADSGLQNSLDGLLRVLDQATSSHNASKMDTAAGSIHTAIDDAEHDLEEQTNLLNLDPQAALQSVTSPDNPTPSSVQFILRTQEIDADEADEILPDEQPPADEGMLARILNIFKKLFSAICSVFTS